MGAAQHSPSSVLDVRKHKEPGSWCFAQAISTAIVRGGMVVYSRRLCSAEARDGRDLVRYDGQVLQIHAGAHGTQCSSLPPV